MFHGPVRLIRSPPGELTLTGFVYVARLPPAPFPPPPLFIGKSAENQPEKCLSHNESHNKFADFLWRSSMCADVLFAGFLRRFTRKSFHTVENHRESGSRLIGLFRRGISLVCRSISRLVSPALYAGRVELCIHNRLAELSDIKLLALQIVELIHAQYSCTFISPVTGLRVTFVVFGDLKRRINGTPCSAFTIDIARQSPLASCHQTMRAIRSFAALGSMARRARPEQHKGSRL